MQSCGELYPVPKRVGGRPYQLPGPGGTGGARGPAVEKGPRDPILIHVFVFPAVIIFVACII